jgi:aspartate aminotransferase-like enzyme
MLLSLSAECSKTLKKNDFQRMTGKVSTRFSTVSVDAWKWIRTSCGTPRGEIAADIMPALMIRKPRLFTPGPTALQPAVQEALARPLLHHRSDEFRSLVRRSAAGLQQFVKTTSEVLILTCSGSGAMEAAVVNTVGPGDRMLACVAGKFGDRWVRLGRAHGLDVVPLSVPWGEVVDAGALDAALRQGPATVVFVQLSESSTGAVHDVRALAEVARRHGALLVVDAISGAGAVPLEMDAWGLDLVVVGSQKALSLPPGLAFVAVGPRAWDRISRVGTGRFYFDLRREREAQASGNTAFSPGIPLVVALGAALDAVEAMGGVDALVANAAALAGATRAAAEVLGMRLVSPRHAGDALTALYPPEGLAARQLTDGLRKAFGARVAGGQGELEGHILRIAHLGWYDALDTLGLLAALEMVVAKGTGRAPDGRAVGAAQRRLSEVA